MAGTSYITGLSSGIDWDNIVTQLIAVEHKSVDLVTNKKTSYENQLSAWQAFASKLSTLKAKADILKSDTAFGVFTANLTTTSATVKGTDLLSVTTDTSAQAGTFTVKVNAVAQAEKRSTASFSSATTALGADFAGDIIINGRILTVSATDTLSSLATKINNLNTGTNKTGITATILRYGTYDYRLVLTADETGAGKMDIKNAGATDVLSALGLADTDRAAKNTISGGFLSDRFTSSTTAIQTLLGLSNAATSGEGEIAINGSSIGALDLATDTLTTLKNKLTAAGLTTSIVEETEGHTTYYRLFVAGGLSSVTDKNNILETLGLITGGVSDVYGVIGDVANTSGGQAISASSLIKDIDGYTGYAAGDYIKLEGTDTAGNAVSDSSFVLSDTTTVGDLLTHIESLFGNVTATVTSDGKIRIIDNTTGASKLAVKIAVKDASGDEDTTLKFDLDGDLGAATVLRKRQLVAGTDASINVDGVEVTSASNTVDDVVPGVTLNLLKADPDTEITVRINRDVDAIISKINDFVTAYNDVASYIKNQTSYDESNQKTGGVLFADGTLLSVKNQLSSLLVGQIWGVDANFSTLGLVGINVDKYGQLSVDTSTLRSYLTTNMNDVISLFTAQAESSSGDITYISHTRNTEAGTYSLNITQAASRSTSNPSDMTGTLSGDETLTITAGSAQATVELNSGMTVDEIVSAINSELSKTYAQKIVGANSLYADESKSSYITAATSWDSVYTESGSAHIAAGDVISFTGTTRTGLSVSGSYTISDPATDTVQGLLTAIEAAYSNTVTASIDATGRIVITDNTTGSSSLALSFNYEHAHDLDFGTVSYSNDGGQKGRYFLDLTAINDGGHLVIRHNQYGSAYSFTIHQANNLIWTSGDQSVANGLDVAGTINGEEATGTGQVMRTQSGLSLKYTGTSTGNVGNLTLTLGVAELFSRALFNMTDSIDGYVTYKQKSLQDTITSLTNKITEMEDRLDKKKALLLSRFAKMELALSQFQSQSNWLSSQITLLNKNWGS
ncbi:MAG TPA: flagellar filament capping protein FliD [Syntrophales bacterium]|nr:flagellar filament capping protein FliD [Syntrophales bacterium]